MTAEQSIHARRVASCSDREIEQEIIRLRDHRLSGIKGTWENLRLEALRNEMKTRDNEERNKP